MLMLSRYMLSAWKIRRVRMQCYRMVAYSWLIYLEMFRFDLTRISNSAMSLPWLWRMRWYFPRLVPSLPKIASLIFRSRSDSFKSSTCSPVSVRYLLIRALKRLLMKQIIGLYCEFKLADICPRLNLTNYLKRTSSINQRLVVRKFRQDLLELRSRWEVRYLIGRMKCPSFKSYYRQP